MCKDVAGIPNNFNSEKSLPQFNILNKKIGNAEHIKNKHNINI